MHADNSPIFACMWSLNNKCWSIILFFFAILISCAPKPETAKSFGNYNPKKVSILNPYFIDLTEEAPTRFADLWNRQIINDLEINEISVYTFGGKNPSDTLEKRLFTFSDSGRNLEYKDYKYDESPAIWSQGELVWSDSYHHLKINFDKHFGIKRLSTASINKTNDGFLVLKRKAHDRFDTTFVRGILDQPKSVVSKIGKNIFSIDVFLPIGSSTEDIKSAFDALSYTDEDLIFAQKNVVFIENDKPIGAFLLNDTFSQVTQTKLWEYDDNGNLTLYEEYIGNATVRSITWTYRDDLLPNTITIGRKQYFYAYK